MSEKAAQVMVFLFALLIVVALISGIINFERACEAKGGHIVNAYKTSLCVSPDGRILE